jgi:hypothetical protein
MKAAVAAAKTATAGTAAAAPATGSPKGVPLRPTGKNR